MESVAPMYTSFAIFPLAILLGLAVLALLIAGVVVLFVKLGAKAFWIVGPVAAVGLLVLMAGMWFVAMPTARSSGSVSHLRTSTPTNARSETWKVARGLTTLVPGSDDRMSSVFLADVYPSAQQAAEALALNVARSFHEPSHGGGTRTIRGPRGPRGRSWTCLMFW